MLCLFTPLFIDLKRNTTVTVESPLTYLTAAVSSYAVFTFLFISYLKADHWFGEFIDSYSMERFNGNSNDFGFLMLAEGLQFSIVISLVGFFLRLHFSDKRISTE